MLKLLIILLLGIFPFVGYSSIDGRLQFNSGMSYYSYVELHELQPTLDVKYNQASLNFSFDSQYFLFRHWLYLGANLDYIGPVMNSSRNDNATFLNWNGYSGLKIPAQPINLFLQAEYFNKTMTPSSSDFGHQNLTGLQYVITGDWNTTGGGMNMYFRYPYWNQIVDHTHYTGGVKFRFITREGSELPYDMQSGWILHFKYDFFKLRIPGTRLIDISYKMYTVSLGFNL